jgi:hypothetical protein
VLIRTTSKCSLKLVCKNFVVCYAPGKVATNLETSLVLIHGIRDSYKTVWISEDTSNRVKYQFLKDREANILEFRYDISDTAPIYSEGIEAEAIRLLQDLIKILSKQPVRAP